MIVLRHTRPVSQRHPTTSTPTRCDASGGVKHRFLSRGTALLSLACVLPLVACADNTLGGPDAIEEPVLPVYVLRAVEEAGLPDGPAAVFDGVGETGGHRALVSSRSLAASGSFATLAAVEDLPLAFSVHPNGGTRDDLSPKTVGGIPHSTSGGFFLICVANGNVMPVLLARVDSIYQSNFTTPSGGHSPGHDYSNTSTGRPLGTYMPASQEVVTDGRFGTTYIPNIASGDEMISLDWVTTDPLSPCVGIPKSDHFRAIVRVPNLVQLTATADIELAPPTSHDEAGFWFLKQETIDLTSKMAARYREKYGQSMTLTAASLLLGGINDINRDWAPPHVEHRIGTDIDIDDKPNNNDPDVLLDMVRLGTAAGFKKCQIDFGNHVHCRQRLY